MQVCTRYIILYRQNHTSFTKLTRNFHKLTCTKQLSGATYNPICNESLAKNRLFQRYSSNIFFSPKIDNNDTAIHSKQKFISLHRICLESAQQYSCAHAKTLSLAQKNYVFYLHIHTYMKQLSYLSARGNICACRNTFAKLTISTRDEQLSFSTKLKKTLALSILTYHLNPKIEKFYTSKQPSYSNSPTGALHVLIQVFLGFQLN